MTPTETIPFQAETRQLLDLVIHSLYTNPEIFLRELVSNASDALDRLRFEGVRRPELAVEPEKLEIRLVPDGERRVLEIVDTGIGMSREEVVENLGTIARSGTRGFLEALRGDQDAAGALPELIGQFGVGFYSAFMVADEVEVETRRVDGEQAVRWRSRGAGDYTVEEIEREEHGTRVVLHLKRPGAEAGQEERADWTEPFLLRQVVRRYSDFIEYPIRLVTQEGEQEKSEILNSRKPLWTRPRSDIDDSEYVEFYRHLSHDWHEPLETIHLKAEGTLEYTALLYVPRERPLDLFDPERAKPRVNLYVKRVFVMADCEEVLPPWLRFVRGILDAADLPLNVSRETLQHDRRMAKIRERLTRKVVDTLAQLLAERREDYAGFWRAFGSVLKEGIYYDDAHREDVARLALFASSSQEAPTTLSEYVERMPVKQQAIFVLLAPDLDAARRSPHLEAYKKKGYEVLFLVEPIDEFVLQRLTEFDGRPLRRVDQGDASELEEEGERSEREAKEKELEPLLEAVRKELAEEVEAVRFSARLTDSPACLVSKEHDLSPQLRRALREAGQNPPEAKRILELNASHPLVARLRELSGGDGERYARFSSHCQLLFGTALVAEGQPPPDPRRYAELVTELLTSDLAE